jgi:hypothetical protein
VSQFHLSVVTVVGTIVVLVASWGLSGTRHAGLVVSVLTSNTGFLVGVLTGNTVDTVHALLVTISRLAVLVVGKTVVADGSALSVVALANLVRSGVLGQSIFTRGGATSASALEHSHELVAATVTRGVVVGRAGAEALLLAAVADQHELDQNREEEEEAANY